MVGERLLFAGLRSGLDLPYECASGVCGSCQAQVVNGSMAAIRNLFPDALLMLGIPSRKLAVLLSKRNSALALVPSTNVTSLIWVKTSCGLIC